MQYISLKAATHTHLHIILLYLGHKKDLLLFPNFLDAFNQIHTYSFSQHMFTECCLNDKYKAWNKEAIKMWSLLYWDLISDDKSCTYFKCPCLPWSSSITHEQPTLLQHFW